MQFEDIVIKMMNKVACNTLETGQYLHDFLRLHQDSGQQDGVQRFKTRIQRLQALLDQAKSSGQTTSASARHEAADVELF